MGRKKHKYKIRKVCGIKVACRTGQNEERLARARPAVFHSKKEYSRQREKEYARKEIREG